MDDEYKWAGVEDPKVMVTTSRDPSSRLKMFAKVGVKAAKLLLLECCVKAKNIKKGCFLKAGGRRQTCAYHRITAKWRLDRVHV